MKVPAISPKKWTGESEEYEKSWEVDELNRERKEVKSGKTVSWEQAVRHLEGCCWSNAIKVGLNSFYLAFHISFTPLLCSKHTITNQLSTLRVWSSLGWQSQVSFSCVFPPLEFIPRTTSLFYWHSLSFLATLLCIWFAERGVVCVWVDNLNGAEAA